jgi:hypothetical protein
VFVIVVQPRASHQPPWLVTVPHDPSYCLAWDIIAVHPEFPTVEEKYQMTRQWSVILPTQFNRRIERGNLVLWRPGFTIWVAVWGNNHNKSATSRLDDIKADVSKDAFDIQEEQGTNALRLSYRLKESVDDKRCPAFYGFVVGRDGHVQIAFYFDDESDLDAAKHILQSLDEKEDA